jgi:hypothetical protein
MSEAEHLTVVIGSGQGGKLVCLKKLPPNKRRRSATGVDGSAAPTEN